MDFITFKNILNDNSIHLNDAYSRIVYYRLGNLKSKPNIVQYGGFNQMNDTDIINRLCTNNCTLNHFIESLMSNNLAKTQWIIEHLN